MTSVDQYNLLRSLALKHGYPWNDQPFALNIVGVRASSDAPNLWDDVIIGASRDLVGPRVLRFAGTTDPGRPYLDDPMRPEGCAVVAEGHHPHLWEAGLHNGQYRALCQRGDSEVTLRRDADKDGKILRIGPTHKEKGNGINLHHGGDTVGGVGRYSAGCQVIRARVNHSMLMQHVDQHEAKGFSKKHGYTLYDVDVPSHAGAAPLLTGMVGRTLRRGDTGPDVMTLQTRLASGFGYGLTIDGSFGTRTEAIVMDVQNILKLTPDGIVGPRTAAAMGL